MNKIVNVLAGGRVRFDLHQVDKINPREYVAKRTGANVRDLKSPKLYIVL